MLRFGKTLSIKFSAFPISRFSALVHGSYYLNSEIVIPETGFFQFFVNFRMHLKLC